MAVDVTGVTVRVAGREPAAGILPPPRGSVRRLLRTRYIVPAIALVLTMGCLPGSLEAVRLEREAAILDGLSRTELLAGALSGELARLSGPSGLEDFAAAIRRLPAERTPRTERLFLFGDDGRLLAADPALPSAPARLTDLFGESQPILIFGERAGAMAVTLEDGTLALAAIRREGSRQVAVVQPTVTLRSSGIDSLLHHRHLLGACVVLLGSLGWLAWHQTRRVRHASSDAARRRRRIESSLARGRCGLWDWDIGRGRITWSRSMYELLGYEGRDDQLSFGDVNAIIHPADGDLYVLAERIAASTASHLEHEFRARTASGTWTWLRARAEVVADPEDGGRHLLGVAVDISDERGFVEQSARNDARLRDAVEAISEAFVLWDSDNRLVLCNSKFRSLHGLTAERVVPGSTYAAIIETGCPSTVDLKVVREGTAETGDRTLEAELADGRWLQVNERRTRDGGYVSVGTDITALKRNEDELRRSEQQLLGTVKDLRASREILETQTQELAELAELYHEQKSEAESASRAKSEFLAKMSHELRTPLNAIIGFAEVMDAELYGPVGDQRYHDYVRHIRSSGHDLLSAINDILQISRIEAGQASFEAEPVELGTVVDRAVSAVQATATAKSVILRTEVPESAVVEGDERALGQILSNLLINAVKFTPAGGAVRVRVRRAGASVNIFVADSGIGIAPDVLRRLGLPFEQAETEASRAQGGAGLGLAIVKALARMHGGTLRIRSERGAGTVAMIHLPATRVLATDAGDAHVDSRVGGAGFASAGTRIAAENTGSGPDRASAVFRPRRSADLVPARA